MNRSKISMWAKTRFVIDYIVLFHVQKIKDKQSKPYDTIRRERIFLGWWEGSSCLAFYYILWM